MIEIIIKGTFEEVQERIKELNQDFNGVETPENFEALEKMVASNNEAIHGINEDLKTIFKGLHFKKDENT